MEGVTLKCVPVDNICVLLKNRPSLSSASLNKFSVEQKLDFFPQNKLVLFVFHNLLPLHIMLVIQHHIKRGKTPHYGE
jgi:hypothetical protein